jgi:uncharacterized protein with gpF-like domain
MASQSDARERTEQAAALALLLASASRRYDLPSLIRSQRIKPRPFRQIRPTNALASNIAAPQFAIVRAWDAEMPAILDAFPFGQAAVAQAIEEAAARVAVTVGQSQAAIPNAITTLERWHRSRFVSRIKAATGLDVSFLTSAQDVAEPVSAATAWNRSLAEDVHQTVRSQVSSALLGLAAAGASQSDAKAKAADVIAKARKRAAGIGTTQAKMTSRAMDRDRRDAAGLASFIWHHSPHVAHPRPEHVARDGRTYSQSNAPNDRAGVLFGCQCWEEPTF